MSDPPRFIGLSWFLFFRFVCLSHRRLAFVLEDIASACVRVFPLINTLLGCLISGRQLNEEWGVPTPYQQRGMCQFAGRPRCCVYGHEHSELSANSHQAIGWDYFPSTSLVCDWFNHSLLLVHTCPVYVPISLVRRWGFHCMQEGLLASGTSSSGHAQGLPKPPPIGLSNT